MNKINDKLKPRYLRADYEEGKDIIIDPDGKVRWAPYSLTLMKDERVGANTGR